MVANSSVLKNYLDYLSTNPWKPPVGDYDRLASIWKELCSKDKRIVMDDEFYAANVTHESLFPFIRKSIPDLNEILNNAQNDSSKEYTFHSFVGSFLRDVELSREEIYQIFAIKKARYTLILDMVQNPTFPVSILLDAKFYKSLYFEGQSQFYFEDGWKQAIEGIPKDRLVDYLEKQKLDLNWRVLPVSAILAVLGY